MLQINIQKKQYGNKIILENNALTITKNGIYGIVGKNGEGKTTFFKCLLGLTDFEGTINLNNQKITPEEMAWSPTEPPIYDELTATEFNRFYAELLRIKTTQTEILFEIPKDKLIKTFSTGMKKKTYFNAVLQKKYKIYIFDEPFNGLDLESNYVLMNYIKTLAQESIVFIASHILEILYKNCNQIFLVKNKKITHFENHQFLEIENELFNNQKTT